MTYEELRDLLLSNFPDGGIEKDLDGQLIIYTGLEKSAQDNDELVSHGG